MFQHVEDFCYLNAKLTSWNNNHRKWSAPSLTLAKMTIISEFFNNRQ